MKADYNTPFGSFFFEKETSEKALSFYFPETDLFSSKQLIPLLLLAHLQSFTGDIVLIIHSKPNTIHFYKGNIIKIVSNSQKSFFGEILVEHGLSLTDDVKQVLNDKSSNKRIGEKLLEKELLSPHMLDFILKEQMKIRLSEFMSEKDFSLKILTKKKESFKKIEVEFNKTDFMDWLADSIQTQLKPDFWKSFYWNIKDYKLSPLSAFKFFSVSQKSFFREYNLFFKSLDKNKKIADLTKAEDSAKFLYFGLLVKSIYLKKASVEENTLEPLKALIDKIISSENIGQFLTELNQPLDRQKIKSNYKNIARQIHPDLLPKNIDESLKKNSEKALNKLTKAYRDLLKQNEEDDSSDLVTIMESYKKGIDLIKQNSYNEAFELFSKMKDHDQAPSNTDLYILWADIKRDDSNLRDKKNKVKATNIQQQIHKYPIHLRTSYLFWFVKGLFYYKCREYQKAKELFEKALLIENRFSAARMELLLVKQKLKEKNKKNSNSFLSFFKKSG